MQSNIRHFNVMKNHFKPVVLFTLHEFSMECLYIALLNKNALLNRVVV